MEERFEDLLNNYLSNDDFNQNIKEEDDLKYKKKNNKEWLDYSEDDAIPISKYVNYYLEIVGDCKNLYNYRLKDKLNDPYIISVSNEYTNKHPEYVRKGYILIVRDAKHLLTAYLNPYIIKEYLRRKEVFDDKKEMRQKRLSDLSKLNDYISKYVQVNEEVSINEIIHSILYDTHKLNDVLKIEKTRKRY